MSKLFRRGEIWYAWVRHPQGGVRKQSTLCTDKRAAETVLAQLEREAADPAHATAQKITTQFVLDEYYRSRQRLGRAEGTLHHTRVKAGALLGLLPVRASNITHAVVQRYVDARLKEGARRTTIKKELRVLKASLKLANKNRDWAGNPDAVIPELDDDYTPGERFLTPWEMVGLATVLEPRRMALVAFAVATGCDPGALWRARREDIAEDLSMVHVRGTKRASRDRMVPLEHPAQATLVAWSLARANASGPLFDKWSNVRRDLHQACGKLGIPGCSPNDLRRTFGTWLREGGVEPHLIGKAMGHADSRMVERVYGKLTPEALGSLLKQRMGGGGRMDHVAGRLMGHRGDCSGTSAALPALPDHSPHAEKQGDPPGFDNLASAQGRNRTADTGIFSPLGDDYYRPVIPVATHADVGAWDIGGRRLAAEPSAACKAFRAQSWLHFASGSVAA
jgi:integrase